MRRVQVKCASWGPAASAHRGSYRCHITSRRFDWQSRQFGYRPYTALEIEFFAIYVLPADTWFIIPCTGVRFSLLLTPHLPDSKYYPFEEAWRLLKQ